MHFRFVGKSPAPGDLVCENKIDAPPTEWQKQGYPSVSGTGLLFLSPGGWKPHPRFIAVRWSELAREADRIGRIWARTISASPGWRTMAMKPDTPSEYRMLAELLRYLEREAVNVNVPGPLTSPDLAVVARVSEVVARWDELFELIVDQLEDLRQEPGEDLESRWDAEDRGGQQGRGWLGYSVTLRFGLGWEGANWPALTRLDPVPERGSWQESVLSPEDAWRPGADHEPAIGVGVGFLSPAGWPPDLEEGSPLRQAIEAGGDFVLSRTNRGRICRIFATLHLGGIASEDTSLDVQAEFVAKWAREKLDALIRVDIS